MKTERDFYTPQTAPQAGTVITDDNGVKMKVADSDTLIEAQRRDYPDGLVIRLPDESLMHLLDLREAVESGNEHLLDEVTFSGRIEVPDRHFVPEGIFQSEKTHEC